MYFLIEIIDLSANPTPEVRIKKFKLKTFVTLVGVAFFCSAADATPSEVGNNKGLKSSSRQALRLPLRDLTAIDPSTALRVPSPTSTNSPPSSKEGTPPPPESEQIKLIEGRYGQRVKAIQSNPNLTGTEKKSLIAIERTNRDQAIESTLPKSQKGLTRLIRHNNSRPTDNSPVHHSIAGQTFSQKQIQNLRALRYIRIQQVRQILENRELSEAAKKSAIDRIQSEFNLRYHSIVKSQ